MGYRLIAISLLPISNSTLVYGSSDGGKNIHKSNFRMNSIMRCAGEKLYIKPHLCGVRAGHAKILSAAADVEGHLGTDGHFYMVDYARTFPPTKPNPNIFRSHLFQVFRPEFLTSYKKLLCPDAFSGFVIQDPERLAYDKEIIAATEYLTSVSVPSVTKELKSALYDAKIQERLDTVRIAGILHRGGVNLRYLGLCFALSDDRLTKIMILIEIIVRLVKLDLRTKTRIRMAELKLPLMTPYIRLFVLFLNAVFYYAHIGYAVSLKYWNQILPQEARLRFHLESFDLGNGSAPYTPVSFLSEKAELPYSITRMILMRLLEAMGFGVPQGDSEIMDGLAPFTALHLMLIEPCVKYMKFIDSTTGNVFFQMACMAKGGKQSVALFREAAGYYERALSSNPNDWETLLNNAECWLKVLIFQSSEVSGRDPQDVVLDPSHQLTNYISATYMRALNVSGENPYVRYKYAKFLSRCGPTRYHAAEAQFLRSLQGDPFNKECLLSYANFLRYQGKQPDWATAFLDRAESLSNSKI